MYVAIDNLEITSTTSSVLTQTTAAESNMRQLEKSRLAPTKVMVKKWFKTISKTVPEVDLIDIIEETKQGNITKRQFAPQYS